MAIVLDGDFEVKDEVFDFLYSHDWDGIYKNVVNDGSEYNSGEIRRGHNKSGCYFKKIYMKIPGKML